ncbi:hypothetical protein [Sporosarcina pasteurii]|uniref:RNase H type-1 domain-containing protein n=1 Tax=Sporosarcina pasteurii TaxID=1474 RepID=A0A380BNB2_SPOPA|nr:hypothetical protein [Sporosarcina pasteurii]MDS9470901.1 hypothetical protein [Sporosarcina pasteurii]QBQ05439.1 hypothetical protein E2C16_07045 [Sporosarcina pasteurii]SUJ03211.1 Uncharacterised protein [Sporosarcina pasteurii]
MNVKNSVNGGGKKPNFWGRSSIKLTQEFKDMIYSQYNSQETLYIYCDCSMNGKGNMMSIACSYVQKGSVTVNSNIIYTPSDCRGKNIYGELQAIVSGLLDFENHIDGFNTHVIIYSDVNHINQILSSKVTFKKGLSLIKQQQTLIQFLNLKQTQNPNLKISIEYLPIDFKYYNPFAKSAHNAARRLLNKPI